MGAYKAIYKPLGYAIAEGTEADHGVRLTHSDETTTPSNKKDAYVGPVGAKADEGYDDADDDDALDEKPIGEMSFRELREYANSLGINANGMTSKKDIREAIKARLH